MTSITEPNSGSNAHSTIAFLPDIADQLASSYRAAGRSERTIESYIESLLQFSAYLVDNGDDDPDTVSSTRVESYIGWVRTTTSAGTARLRFASIRAIWRWMIRRGFATSDPFIAVPAPVVDQKVMTVLDDEDVRAILQTTDGTGFLDRRDKAILLVLCDSGCRRGDIANAKVDDLDLVTGRLLLRGTKSNRDRQIALSPITTLAVKRWLRERDRVTSGRKAVTNNLFTNSSGGAITADAVYQLVERRYRQAGVPVERAVHSFRSWAAVKMIANGGQESEIMSLMGWKSQTMLLRYLRGTQHERALTRHESFSPVSGLR